MTESLWATVSQGKVLEKSDQLRKWYARFEHFTHKISCLTVHYWAHGKLLKWETTISLYISAVFEARKFLDAVSFNANKICFFEKDPQRLSLQTYGSRFLKTFSYPKIIPENPRNLRFYCGKLKIFWALSVLHLFWRSIAQIDPFRPVYHSMVLLFFKSFSEVGNFWICSKIEVYCTLIFWIWAYFLLVLVINDWIKCNLSLTL